MSIGAVLCVSFCVLRALVKFRLSAAACPLKAIGGVMALALYMRVNTFTFLLRTLRQSMHRQSKNSMAVGVLTLQLHLV